MTTQKDEMTSLKEAENEVKVVTQRLALLHLAFSKTLVREFGWKRGKRLILMAIKEYGLRVADRTKRGYQSLPKYGFWEKREGEPSLCEFGKIVLEFDEKDIGSLYCLIDSAKTMAANPAEKLIHTKCLTIGDDYCDFAIRPTTIEDRQSFFTENKDWSSVDPRLGDFYKTKEND